MITLLAEGDAAAFPALQQGWTAQRETTLPLPMPPHRGRLRLELALDPQLVPAHPRHRRVALALNGTILARRRLGGPLLWRQDLPSPLPAASQLCLIDEDWTAADPSGLRLGAWQMLQDTTPAPPAPRRPLHVLAFGWNETTEALLGPGFGAPEDTYSWAYGARSTLCLPVPEAEAPWCALLDMTPFTNAAAPRQRITIELAGAPPLTLTAAARTVFALDLPRAANGRSLTLHFHNHDAAYDSADPVFHFGRPFAFMLHSIRLLPAPPAYLPGIRPRLPGMLADGSLQAIVRQLTGEIPETLICGFEGLGNGCEFGNTRAAFGQGGPSLLRFSGTTQWQLVRALLAGFADVFRLGGSYWAIRRPEDDTWRLFDGTYGFGSATPYPLSAPPPDLAREARLQPRLAAKLLEQLSAGEHIFVMRTPYPASEPEIRAVLAALRYWGDGELLWLTTERGPPPGTAMRLACGAFRAWQEPPEGNRPISTDTMLSALANTRILHRQAAPLPPPGA